MLITHELDPGEMLAEILKGRRGRSADTERLASLRHDRDLCPRVHNRIKAMLDVYAAYRQDAHDIQGLRDEGVDILLKYRDRDDNEHLAGVQIKSHAEFDEWKAGKNPLPMKLKAQYAAATQALGVTDYYILLCVDEVVHQKHLRLLNSELKAYGGCTIIDPRDALGFLETPEAEITARVTRILCRDDLVLSAAIEEMDREEPDAAYMLLALTCQALGGDLVVTETWPSEIWNGLVELAPRQDRPGRLEGAYGALQGGGLLKWEGAWDIIQLDALPKGVCALYYDQIVRGLDGGDIFSSLLDLLGVGDRLR